MKKLCLVFIITICFITARAQSEDTLQLICRKWKIEKVSDELYNKLDSAEKEDFKSALVVFTKDGKYNSFLRNKEVDAGSWTYIPSARKLVCTSIKGINKTTIIILSITKNEMKAQGFDDEEEEGFQITFSAIK